MTKPGGQSIHEVNRLSWNAATAAHNSHKHDQAGFLRQGGSTLFPEEIDLLGEVSGRRLLHLQCNAGQDTLSLASRGATVTGIDISDEAIRFARQLSTESGIPATFDRTDLYDWLEAPPDGDARFDIVFCSYGAICWLSDLERWARGVAGMLIPGGRFVTLEFHPASMMYNERLELEYSYFGNGVPQKWEDGVDDYVAASEDCLTPSGYQDGIAAFSNPHPVHEFQWHLGAILSALLNAGMHIAQFHEYPFSNGARLFENMRKEPGGRWFPPSDFPAIPLMYGIVAEKPAPG
ncbi:MAG: class I SAM-dependent methyltransferase [bacterium]|nr:class I SAM-dependent methyltransferase [bacterium]